MRVIVIGCGRVGSGLAIRLSLEGHHVAVIDVDSVALEALGPRFGGTTVRGLGFDRDALSAAGIDRADALAAVTGSDEVNAVVARIAARRYRVPRVVARLFDPRTAEIYRRLGVQTISPVAWGIGRLAGLLAFHDSALITTLGSGQVDVLEAVVPQALDGRPASDVEVPGDVRATAITRGGRTFIPDAATRLHSQDVLALAVSAAGASRVEELFGAQ